jgi:hypothetical protein
MLFGCSSTNCPVCLGLCRHQERVFVPSHWQAGNPGQIYRL